MHGGWPKEIIFSYHFSKKFLDRKQNGWCNGYFSSCVIDAREWSLIQVPSGDVTLPYL